MEQEQVGFLTSLRELGPWIISLIALLQVWVVAAWRKYRPGKIEMYEKDQIEIGYSLLSPTLALSGTMRSIHRDVFLSSLKLSVKRLRDGAVTPLAWYALRPTSFRLTDNDPIELRMAAGFLLRTTDPVQFNVICVDPSFTEEKKAALDRLRADWYSFSQKRLVEVLDALDPDAAESVNHQHLTEAIFDEYIQQGRTVDIFSSLNQSFFWHPGEYTVQVTIEVARPSRNQSWDFTFAMSPEDSEALSTNATPSIKESIGLRFFYSFAYPKIVRGRREST